GCTPAYRTPGTSERPCGHLFHGRHFFLQPFDDAPHVALHVLEALAAQSFRIDDARDVGHGALELIVQYHVLEHRDRAQLAQRTHEPRLERFGRLCVTAPQPIEQHFAGRGQHVDQHRLGKHGAELRRALHVDVHDHVAPLAQHAGHLAAQRPVQMSVYRRRFRELAALLALEKLGRRQKIVVLSVHFVRARPSCGTRHRVPDIRPPLEQHVRNRRLAAARGRREDDGENVHSTFSTCSAIRSNSSFPATTSCVMIASRALLPVVFASRSISCKIKPRRFPTWPSFCSCNASRNAAMCARNRSISSATSNRSARMAISCANRCGSTSTPPDNSFTDSRNRSRSDTNRSGARAAMRSTARSTVVTRSSSMVSMRVPSASRIFVSAASACWTMAVSSSAEPDSSCASLPNTSGRRRMVAMSRSFANPYRCC